MNGATQTMIVSLLIALGGWLATAHWIKSRQRLNDQYKRMLIVPAWFPWMGIAMGGPVVQGQIAFVEAAKIALSFSCGMLFYMYMARRNARKH